MNIRLLPLIALGFAIGVHAQDQTSGDSSSPLRSMGELKELLGPIALYPDPLISLVLPATTVPSDIVLADRFATSGGDPDDLDGKPWDQSVKALTHYPDTLKWLDDNLDWTAQVGDAFTNQPDDVMSAIQALRGKAKTLGNLVDTPEQTVVDDDSSIRIVPADPDYIYEPRYDADVVYDLPAPLDEPAIYFSTPYIVGPWLGFDFDWYHRRLYWGEWHHGWDYGRDRDRGRSRGGNVYVNNSLRNTVVWKVNSKRRISTGAAKTGSRSKSTSGVKPPVVKPTTIPKAKGVKPGTPQPKPAPVKPAGKTGSPGKAPTPKSSAPGSGPGKAPMPKSSAPGTSPGKAPMPKSSAPGTSPGKAPMPKSSAPGTGPGKAPMPKTSAPGTGGGISKPKTSAPGIKGDLPKTNSDSPKSKPKSSDSPKSKPRSSDSPKPKSSDSPKPRSSDSLKPRSSDSPKPRSSDSPKPRAAPVQQPRAAPVQQPRPAPVQQPRPAPVQQPRPAPVQQPRPAAPSGGSSNGTKKKTNGF